jgi:hypothetical protein
MKKLTVKPKLVLERIRTLVAGDLAGVVAGGAGAGDITQSCPKADLKDQK